MNQNIAENHERDFLKGNLFNKKPIALLLLCLLAVSMISCTASSTVESLFMRAISFSKILPFDFIVKENQQVFDQHRHRGNNCKLYDLVKIYCPESGSCKTQEIVKDYTFKNFQGICGFLLQSWLKTKPMILKW